MTFTELADALKPVLDGRKPDDVSNDILKDVACEAASLYGQFAHRGASGFEPDFAGLAGINVDDLWTGWIAILGVEGRSFIGATAKTVLEKTGDEAQCRIDFRSDRPQELAEVYFPFLIELSERAGEREWKIEDLAERLDVTDDTIRNYANGKTKPPDGIFIDCLRRKTYRATGKLPPPRT